MMHVDDLLVVGKRDYVLGKFLPELKAAYDIQFNALRSQVMSWHFWNDSIHFMMMEDWQFKRMRSTSPSFAVCLDCMFETRIRKALHMLILKRNMTQQTFHLHHPRLLGHVLVFCCIWRMMFHKLNMSFDIWPPTVQSPLKRVSQCFDIWWDIFAATCFTRR